jgi:predicted DNA-binding protein (MmcQ/YjbR family)
MAKRPKPRAKTTKRTASKRPASKRTTNKRAPSTSKRSTKKARVSTHPAKIRTAVSEALIERLRPICMALPDTTEVIAWGEPTWRVRGKIFAQLDDHHHGAAHVSVWLPAPEGAQAALIDAEPDRIFRPPYVGHKGWIAVILDGDCDWAMVEALVAQAHDLIAAGRPSR